MKINFRFTILGFFIILLLASIKPVLAAVRCETQYGGREVCVRTGQLQVDKEVFNPQEKKFVDNLGLNDYKFSPGEEVAFKIKVKNVGDAPLSGVNVMDTLPSLLNSSGGSPFFQIKELKVGETKEQEIKVRVVSADKFPGDKSIVCVVNAAQAVSGEDKDRDTTQLCLERKLPLEKGAPAVLPPTGPEHWLAVIISSILVGTTGIYLIRVSKK